MQTTAKNRPRRPSTSIEARACTVLQDRFKIMPDKVVGCGAFAKVYKGLDMKECRGVAVKVYNNTDSQSLESFMKSVEVLTRLHRQKYKGTEDGSEEPNSLTFEESHEGMGATGSFKPDLMTADLQSLSSISTLNNNRSVVDKALKHLRFEDCFVKLLGWSTDHAGNPGLDIATETYFLVFELGEASLDEVLAQCKDDGKTLSVDELRSLHWALVSIVCGLHSEGFVHLDIKPLNIVRFSPEEGRNNNKPQWKLIDLDGALRTGIEVSVSDVVFTPQYMPPELAVACTAKTNGTLPDGSDSRRLKLSRLMDVWSVGMCALEAIFLTPVLDPWYQEWLEETGNENKFLNWLADSTSEPIVSGPMQEALAELDAEMCGFLKGMLAKDPKQRLCINECVNHAWLKPIRQEIKADIDELVESALKPKGKGSLLDPEIARSETPGGKHKLSPEAGRLSAKQRSVSGMSTASGSTSATGAPSRWRFRSESAQEVAETPTEKAKIVAGGVVTRTCAVM